MLSKDTQGNVYYVSNYIKSIYTRTAPNTPPRPLNPASGGFDPYSGDWGSYPNVLFMYGEMEGLVWPYPSAPVRTPEPTVTPSPTPTPTPVPTPGPETLRGHWKLDDGSGTVAADSSGYGHDGTVKNGAVWTTGPQEGALYFDGTNDYVEIPYSPDLNNPVFSVALWARVEGGSGSYRAAIASRDVAGTPIHGYLIYAGSDNKWQFWIGDGVSNYQKVTGTAVTTDWIHLTATYDGSTMKFYNNGILVSSKSVSYQVNTQRPLRIGAGNTEGNPGFFFNGCIDDVRFYDRALSESEIQALLNQ